MPPDQGGAEAAQQARPLGRIVALNTTLLTIGRLVTAGGGVVGIALITHYLSQGEFGQLLAAQSFVGIFQVSTDLGLWTIASREIARAPQNEEAILGAVFTVGLGLLVVTIAGGLIAAFAFYGGSTHTLTREAIGLLLIQFLIAGFAGSAAAHLAAHQRAVAIAISALVSSLLFLGLLIVVVTVHLGFLWVVAAYTLAAVTSPVLPIISMLRRVRLRLNLERALIRQMVRTTLPQGLLLVLSVAYFRIDTVLLSLLSSNRQVALYGLAYRFVEFFAFLPVYFMGVLFPVLARTPAFSRRLDELVSGALDSMIVGGLAALAFTSTFAPQIVAILAGGHAYAHTVALLRLLSVALLTIFLSNAFFQTLIALNRQRSLIRLIAVVLVVNLGANVALIPPLGATGAAVALIISEIVGFVLAANAYREVGRLPRPTRLWRILVATAGLAAGGWLTTHFGFPHDRLPGAALVVGGIVAALVYIALMRGLRALPPPLAATLGDVASRAAEVIRALRHRDATGIGA